MNTKRVQAAEGVVLAALKTRQLAVGVAIALESACLLQSPETAAEQVELRETLERRTDLLRDVQKMLRQRAAEAKGRQAYGDRLKTENAELRAEVRRLRASESEMADVIAGTGLSLYEEEQETARLLAERHSTNEALSDAAEQLRVQRDRIAALEGAAAKVAAFCAKRAEYVDSLRNCHPDNAHDYYRWTGHAEARRQLSQLLGLPVGWPAEDTAKPHPSEGELAEQRHLVDELDHSFEALALPHPTDAGSAL